MAASMISGPDLGGGYLHQLTMDARRSPNLFTYHAQAGGQDAGGPPLGSLAPLDFRHPKTPCPFGGPRCWEREFELPGTFQARVRQAYNRFRFVLSAQLEQLYANRAPTIESALVEIASRLGEPSPTAEKFWYVGGSTAVWLQGVDIAPRDIDLGANRDGVDRLAQSLVEYLVEPVAPTHWASRSVYGARAFVGTMQDGARVEWGVDRKPRPDGGEPEWSADPRQVRLETVDFHGHRFFVTRPEYALVRAIQQEATERIEKVSSAVRALGPDRDLLARLAKHARLNAAGREALAQL